MGAALDDIRDDMREMIADDKAYRSELADDLYRVLFNRQTQQ